MKANMLGLFLMIMSVQGSFAQQTNTNPSAAEQEIINLSRQKWLWMADKNVDSLNVLFDAKAMFVHMGGTWGKEREVDIIKTGFIWYKKAEVYSASVRRFGNIAIILNDIDLVAVVSGNEVTNPFMVTEVYIHPDRLIDLIIHNEVVPVVNQIETHPFHQQIQTQKFLQENYVQIESWGPFAEGKNNIFHNELLLSIGKKHNKSIAQVILRWLIQRGVVTIPKSVRKERMEENFNIFDFELNAEDIEAIKTLDTKTSSFFDHRDPVMVKWLGERKLAV